MTQNPFAAMMARGARMLGLGAAGPGPGGGPVSLQDRVDAVVDSAIARKTIVGAVTVVAKDGRIVYRKAAGHFDREAGTPMYPEAIFRLASVTKPIISAAALAMIDKGVIGLNDVVSAHIPWFKPKLPDGSHPPITIRQLLNHTSGLTYAIPPETGVTAGLVDSNLSLKENFSLYAERVPLLFTPGTGWEYGISTDVLGAVIEAVTASTLHDALLKHIGRPLGWKDTGFVVPAKEETRLAVPYADGPPGLRRMTADPEMVYEANGQPFFPLSPGRALNPKAFQSGGAGGVGTADEILQFLEAIRTGGAPILKPETVAEAVKNQVGDLPLNERDAGHRFGYLAAIIVDPKPSGRVLPKGTLRWGGAWGHEWFMDTSSGLSAVMMTNTTAEGVVGAYTRDVPAAIYGT